MKNMGMLHSKSKKLFQKLNDEEDQVIWCLNPMGNYDPRLGYKSITMEGNNSPQS
jgi:hypothetical protein